MNELVACVIGLAVGSSVNFAQAAAQVIDFYMREDRSKERTALIAACCAPDGDAKAAELIRGFVREGMRLNPQFGGLFRVCVQDDVVPQGAGFADMQVKKGDLLFASFKNAHLNVRLLSPYVLSSDHPHILLHFPLLSRMTSRTPLPSTRRDPRAHTTSKARASMVVQVLTSSRRHSLKSCARCSACPGYDGRQARKASARASSCISSTRTTQCIYRGRVT